LITNLSSFFFHQIRQAEDERDRVYEPVIGIVTDNKDPDGLLRVKVRLPSISSVDSTWWIPVVSLGAGKERGWFFLPEVNDEVLVAFEHGDVNRPVVIGALWNGNDKPPEEQSASNPKRVLVSRAGSRIELDDDKNTIVIKDSGGKGEITFKADDNKLVIEAKQGDVVVKAGKDLQIVADGGIEVTASMNLDVRAGTSLNIEGNGAKIAGSGVLQASGGMTSLGSNAAGPAAKATGQVTEYPDPIAAAAGGAGGGATSGGAAPVASPAPASPPARTPGPSAAASDEKEPAPVLLLGRWERNRVPVSTDVKLQALCNEMDGQTATFTIKDAESEKVVATVTGACGASSVEARWKTPSSGPPVVFVFDVAAAGQTTTSDELTIVQRVEAKLVLDEEPAANVRVKLRSEATGEVLSATADSDGVVVFEEASLGEHTLILEDA
jgi:phage baseplate assembly protein gpV